MTLAAYKELECDNIQLISTKIYTFLKDKTKLLANGSIGWQFINVKELLLDIQVKNTVSSSIISSIAIL